MATNFYFQKVTDVTPLDIESTFNVRVKSTRGLTQAQPKELFKREWANEDGVDVYVPSTRLLKSATITISCYAAATETKTAIELYDDICDYMIGAEFDYWDTLQNKKVNLTYISHKLGWLNFVPEQKLEFEITLLNKTGARTDV